MKGMELPVIQKRLEAVPRAENPDETDLYMYGAVVNTASENAGMTASGARKEKDVISAREVREKLAAIQTSVINVHINSGGGSAYDGIAIGNMLKEHPARIVGYIDGIAASAASVVAMACDEIVMYENSVMMIHRAMTGVFGNAEKLTEAAEGLKTLDASVFNSYKGRFVGSAEELTQLIANETYMTADECLALGFCDRVIRKQAHKTESKTGFKTEMVNKYLAATVANEPTKNNGGELVFNLLNKIGGKEND